VLPEVSGSADTAEVEEGTAAAFTLTRTGSTAAALTVAVSVTETGSFIDGTAPAAVEFAPEVASLNMGSMNFGLFPMLRRYDTFKHSWEREALESSRSNVFRNSFEDIENILRACSGNGTRFEFECYDTSHLYNLSYFLDEGLVQPPLFIQTVFGIFGGIGTHPEDIAHMKRTADRLFGVEWQWSVLGAGGQQMRVAAFAAAQGGNVRVGLEDSLWDGPGRLADSNAAQVTRVCKILDGLSLDPASPDEARSMLSLKGGDAVRF